MLSEDREPSDLFMKTFCGSGIGTPQAECSCGRINYAGSSEFMEEGELDSLRERTRKNPNRFIGHENYEAISVRTLAGRNFVLGCPCNGLKTYEDFLLTHPSEIARYFEEHSKEQLRRVEELIADSQRISEAVKKL